MLTATDGSSGRYTPAKTETPPPPVVQVETKPQESLNDTGKRYGVSGEEMSRANPGVSDADAPLPDQTTVNVPTGDGEGVATAQVVQPGESPADIASQHGITEDDLRQANNLGPGEAVYPGAALLIPTNGDPTTGNPATSASLLTPEGLVEQFPSLAGRSQEDMQAITENVGKLSTGSPEEKVQALAALAGDLRPEEVDTLAKELKLENNDIYKLVTNREALGALSTLANPDASASDKAAAALTLTKSLGEVVPGKAGEALAPFLNVLPGGNALIEAYNTFSDPDASNADKITAGLTLAESLGKLAPEKLKEALDPVLSFLPAGRELVDAITKWADPNASALDKAKAALDVAQAVRNSAGEAFPSIANKLRSLDGGLRILSAGLTLLDPNATLEDKAKAALTLAADVPQLAGDLNAIRQFLTQQRIPADEAQRIADQIQRLPAVERLPESVRTSLDPDVAANLTPEQADQIAKRYAEQADALRTSALNGIDPSDTARAARALEGADKAATEFGQSINKVLGELNNPEAVNAFLRSFDSAADVNSRKALVDMLAGLKPGAADTLLTSTVNGKPAGEVLNSIIGKFGDDKDALNKFINIIKEGDGRTVSFALQLADSVDGKVLKETLGVIGDAKVAGQALAAIAAMLDNTGVKLTADIAGKVLKGVAKAIPIAGAIPAGIDTVRMAQIAADTSLPPDIRYMAMQAAKLNGVDAALSVAEPFIAAFFGIPVAVDIALAVAGIGLDIMVSSQVDQARAQGDSYQSPDWMKMVNVAMAAAQGPQGAAELALIYGPEGAVELAGGVARMTGNAAISGVELQQTLAAQGVGKGMELSADGIRTLADMIRNPEKYGDAAQQLVRDAVGKLNQIAQGAGALAAEAGEQLGNLVNDLKALGEQGIETLGWIAQNPGEAANLAAQALGDLAQQGLRTAGEAGKLIAEQAMAALGTAREALGAAGQAVEQAINDTVSTAVSLGKQGIETLGWIANNPGEAAKIAQQALVDVASQAGELAQDAYDQLKNLGEQGVELIKDVVGKLQDAGEAGVELLQYVVENPGEAAQAVREAALDGLKNIAEGATAAAQAATDAITGFVDAGIQEAKDTVTDLLKNGGAAAERIISTWSNELSEGAKDVIDALGDLGDAIRDEILSKLANAGINYARDVWNTLRGDGVPFIPGI